MRFWTKICFRTRNHVGTGGIIAESLRLSDVAWDLRYSPTVPDTRDTVFIPKSGSPTD